MPLFTYIYHKEKHQILTCKKQEPAIYIFFFAIFDCKMTEMIDQLAK